MRGIAGGFRAELAGIFRDPQIAMILILAGAGAEAIARPQDPQLRVTDAPGVSPVISDSVAAPQPGEFSDDHYAAKLDHLATHPVPVVVVDPVMVATSGDRLLTADAEEALRQLVRDHATVVTPNIPEAARLLGVDPARLLRPGGLVG